MHKYKYMNIYTHRKNVYMYIMMMIDVIIIKTEL